MRLSNFFIESIGLYLPETYRTESAVADGYLADTREKTTRSRPTWSSSHAGHHETE